MQPTRPRLVTNVEELERALDFPWERWVVFLHPAQRQYRNRAGLLSRILADAPNCQVTPPEGGMFVLLDVRGTGLGSEDFARGLLARENVAVVPCDGFGPSAAGHLRIALTAPEPRLEEAGRRIVRFARQLAEKSEG